MNSNQEYNQLDLKCNTLRFQRCGSGINKTK